MKSLILLLLLPLRYCVVHFSRGFLPRKACILILKHASRRRSLMASISIIRPLDRRDISFEASDSSVLDDVYWFGMQGYEGPLPEIWSRLCAVSENILEIGGNVGIYTVVGAKRMLGKYTVLEPVPQIARILSANIRRNDVSSVEVLEAAAIPGDDELDVTLNIPNEGRSVPVGAHLVKDVEICPRSTLREIKVKGVPFTKLAAGRDLIKIDAEGIEHALLAAAVKIIERYKPTIVVEVLPEAEKLARLLRSLANDNGYIIHIVPAYGDRRIIQVTAADFTSRLPSHFHAKDVVLSRTPLPPPAGTRGYFPDKRAPKALAERLNTQSMALRAG
jgi:FkbM family methyltransferase